MTTKDGNDGKNDSARQTGPCTAVADAMRSRAILDHERRIFGSVEYPFVVEGYTQREEYLLAQLSR
jgi:hypothetical protein